MSSDGAGAVMGEGDEAQGLVPKRRFPEFDGEWQRPPMNEVYRFKGNNPLSRDQLNYEDGDLKTIHYGDIHTKFAAGFRVNEERVPFINRGEHHSSLRPDNWCSAGDIVFADASEDMNDIGKAIEVLDIGDVPLTAGMHTILASPDLGEVAVGFGRYLFACQDVRRQIQGEAQGAKVLGISPIRLGSIKLPIPTDTAEQLKIADCLSSLDAVIAAEGERLAALRDHKKGLMQALFPAPGQTTPRLRFPEFQDAGEWEEREVGEVFTVTRGNVLAMPLVDNAPSERKPYPVYSSQTKRSGLAGYYSEFLYDDAITWTTDGANAGEVNYRAGKFYCTNVCGVLLSTKGYANTCVAEIINSVSRDYVSYVGNPKLMNGVMARIVVAMPSIEEQQKISDWLTSINAAIAASANKIEALKTHKAGLMQQLFPTPAGATA